MKQSEAMAGVCSKDSRLVAKTYRNVDATKAVDSGGGADDGVSSTGVGKHESGTVDTGVKIAR